MRLPKDQNKIRGYGYVEFEDRQSLIDALSMTNTVNALYYTLYVTFLNDITIITEFLEVIILHYIFVDY